MIKYRVIWRLYDQGISNRSIPKVADVHGNCKLFHVFSTKSLHFLANNLIIDFENMEVRRNFYCRL